MTDRGYRYTAGQVAEALVDRAEEICSQFLPLGRREGHHWVEASRARGGLGDSLKVKLDGSDRGRWWWYAAGEGGDLLELINRFGFEGRKSDAYQWCLDYLGWRKGDGTRPAVPQLSAEELAARRAAADEAMAAKLEKTIRYCRALFFEAKEHLIDTPVDLYLHARGIDLERLAAPPHAIRFHPGLKHRQTSRQHPAMLGAVQNLNTRKIVGVHRTYLEPTPGRDGWQKLSAVSENKLSLGAIRGGVIPLSRGADGKQWSKMAPDSTVYVSEGIEDGLTAALVDPEKRVCCGISLGNMMIIEWPEAVTRIVLLGQNDPEGPATALRERVLSAWADQGKMVRIIMPPSDAKDLNDALLAGGARG